MPRRENPEPYVDFTCTICRIDTSEMYGDQLFEHNLRLRHHWRTDFGTREALKAHLEQRLGHFGRNKDAAWREAAKQNITVALIGWEWAHRGTRQPS